MFNSNYATLPVSVPIGMSNGGGFGNGNGFDDIIALAIIAMILGWNGNGGGIFGGGGSQGAATNYVLSSDFATIQRQLSDGFGATESKLDSISNGICSLGYDQLNQMNGINMNIMQSANVLQSQLADCCCKTQSGIESVKTAGAFNTAAITGAIKDCCCENEKIAMQNRYESAQSHCETLQAIDKLGDRLEDKFDAYISQQLRDENQALKWQQSQDRQNLFIQNLVKPQINPCYITQNPYCSYGNANPYAYGYYGTTVA